MIESDPFKNADEASEFHAKAFRKFIFRRGVIDPSPNDLVNPDELALRRPRQSFLEGEHASAAQQLTQEVSIRINELFVAILGLKTWGEILPENNPTERDPGDFRPVNRYYSDNLQVLREHIADESVDLI